MVRNKTLKKIWNITTTVVVALVVVIAIFLIGLRIVGLEAFTVLSGSMEPKYSVGDLIYVKNVDPKTIQVGDPITFVMNEELTVATHTVIKIDTEKQHFYTKGEANDTPDATPVHFNNLIGKPQFSIPYLGYVSNWIQNPPGTYIAITAAIILILILFVPDFFKKKDDSEVVTGEALADERAELDRVREELAAAKAELEAAQANKGENKPD